MPGRWPLCFELAGRRNLLLQTKPYRGETNGEFIHCICGMWVAKATTHLISYLALLNILYYYYRCYLYYQNQKQTLYYLCY